MDRSQIPAAAISAATTTDDSVIPNLTRGCRPYALVENVVTHRKHRNLDWGEAVFAHTLDFAWSLNCYKVMLLTGRKDEATLRYYEKAGFAPHGKRGICR